MSYAAMIPEQATAVAECAGAPHVRRVWIKCKPCGTRIGLVKDPIVTADDGETYFTTYGAVLDAYRFNPDYLHAAQQYTEAPPNSLPDWSNVHALIEHPTAALLPAPLPLWCPECGPTSVPLTALLSKLAQACHEKKAVAMHVAAKA